ncbi:MAG: 16S rRNA (adenine(1518)-N(6)/adenine(1519)-N(6))-dimethyltransferase RsmA [Euryarchaeota archaeon]|nr:16S rRNA (adenine(1518)-N(6)/adenine(1519)-N(6))-dimethyltransferase RsmA [Euryarchaeota archaeon]
MRPAEIKAILAPLSLTPTKGRGQNFLTDDLVAEKEVDYLGIEDGDAVLEVGPGLGVLTDKLVKAPVSLKAIELDDALVPYLRKRFPDKVDIVHGDALSIEWPRFDRFISNVPYSISSPLIFKLLDHDFKQAVVMVQKEFADRMGAKADTDDYGRLSVGVYYRAECEPLDIVKRNCFWPEPEVDSRIVRLTRRPAPFSIRDERLFFKLVEMLFAQRRKKISTVLKRSHLMDGMEVSALPHIDKRVEALSPEEIGELADAIYDARAEHKGRRTA